MIIQLKKEFFMPLFMYKLYIVRMFANNIIQMKKEYTSEEEQLAKFAKALGHPARIAILKFLASQESCFFGDIHEVLPIAKATVSQHLTELKHVGLIQCEILPPKVKYCINKENCHLSHLLIHNIFCIKNTHKDCCK